MKTAVENIDGDITRRVCNGTAYRWDICLLRRGSYTEYFSTILEGMLFVFVIVLFAEKILP